MICPKCGAPVPGNAAACPYCNASLRQGRTQLTGEETRFAASAEDVFSTAPSDQTEMADSFGTPTDEERTELDDGSHNWMRRTQEERGQTGFEIPGGGSAGNDKPNRKKETRTRKKKAEKRNTGSQKKKAAAQGNVLRIVLLVVLALLIIALILR